MSAGFGHPFGYVPPTGAERSNPTWRPTPNSEPEGSMTGAPVRTVLRSVPLLPNVATVVAPGTRENRVLLITAPDISFTVYVGDSSVSALTGYAVPPGQQVEIPLVGLQEVYAVTDAPVTVRVQIQISMILAAETERRY
jgi:hypothetical protein